jgi:hypothetical protein
MASCDPVCVFALCMSHRASVGTMKEFSSLTSLFAFLNYTEEVFMRCSGEFRFLVASALSDH